MITPTLPHTEERIVYDMPFADYLQAPGVSNSQLKLFSRSPAHFKASLLEVQDAEDWQNFGTIAHQLVFEPEKPHWWAVKPAGMDGRTKEGKAWARANRGKTHLSAEEWTCIQGVANAVRNHPTASMALDAGKSEVSVFKRGPGGLLRKARMDRVTDGDAIVDLKTTEDARPSVFGKEVARLKYYMQAAYYLDIWNDARPPRSEEKKHFVIIAVEKEPPFAVSVFDLSERAIEEGRKEYQRLLAQYAECVERNEWPAYPTNVTTLDLPRWAYQSGLLTVEEMLFGRG